MSRNFNKQEAKSIGDQLGIQWKQVDLDEFKIGLSFELEHGKSDPETNVTDNDLLDTGKIAWAHLKEMPDYYTRLKNMEDEGKKEVKNKLKVETAITQSQVAYGLMDRKHLDKDSGMLFKFQQKRPLSFWGQRTYIPLDILFLDSDLNIESIKQIEPMSTKMVTSDSDCIMAIETNAGYCQANGISVGDKVKINGSEVEFVKC